MTELIIDETDASASVFVRDGSGDRQLPALWLRERSSASDAVDATTGQRLFDPHLLPVDLSLRAAKLDPAEDQLRVWFSDGHDAVFDVDDLIADLTLSDGSPERILWSAGLGHPPVHSWSGLTAADAEFAALTDFLALGAIVIDGVPTVPGTLLQVASRFGFVRETNFGVLFEVRSQPGSIDLAYRSVALGPHTDNPYRSPAPGVQLLHCLVNETSGGASTLVDGLAAVERLNSEDPDAVDLLATVPVRFRFRDASTEIVSIRPILVRDHDGTVTGLHYSPRLDEMPLMPLDELRRYHSARRRLARLLADEAFEVRFTLAAGQVMMFDNNRVLHGRSAFEDGEGLRHLQGCYIDRDGPPARFRVLARTLADAGRAGA